MSKGSTFETEFQGTDEFAKQAQGSDAQINTGINNALRDIGRTFVTTKGAGPLAEATPVITGALAQSTIFQIMGGTKAQKLEIRQGSRTAGGSFYGHFVREGTKAHTIRPRNAKMLHFFVQGSEVFAYGVNHPGTKPNPYHRQVFSQHEASVDTIMARLGERINTYLSGTGDI